MNSLLKTTSFLLIAGLFLLTAITTSNAQKVLNASEEQWVNEAKSELKRALSDMDMNQAERILIVQKSAKTLKEYGQEPAFPQGDIPLKKEMQRNYNLAKKGYNDLNAFQQTLIQKKLDQQISFINSLQIEVVEEQVKLLIPGESVVELSKDLLVSSFFQWDIVEGITAGQADDAAALTKRFKQLAATGKLLRYVQELFKHQRMSMNQLHRDLNLVTPLQEMLRKKYQFAEATTMTMSGYEGAVIAKKTSSNWSATATADKQATSSGSSTGTRFYLRLVKTETVKEINNPGRIGSLTATDNSFSAAVKPPSPKEPYTAQVNWNMPPTALYPGESFTITAKANGASVRISGTSQSFSSLGKYDRKYVDGGQVATYTFTATKDNVGMGRFTVEVVPMTASTWAWSTTFYTYESVTY